MEHAPHTLEGWQIWDIISNYYGQLRIAPSGVAVGLDAAALIKIAELIGYELYPFTLLFPYAERGAIAGVNNHLRNQET